MPHNPPSETTLPIAWGAGEPIPEVKQRAAQQIRHHAGRPLEFRVRPRA
jgi:hypothetical protein